MAREQENIQHVINVLEKEKHSIEAKLEGERVAAMERIRKLDFRIGEFRDTMRELYGGEPEPEAQTRMQTSVKTSRKTKTGSPTELIKDYLLDNPSVKELSSKEVVPYMASHGYKTKTPYPSAYQACLRLIKEGVLKKSGRKFKVV